MKRTIGLWMIGLLIGLMPLRTYAQYASTYAPHITAQKESGYVGQGQGLADAGKTIMLTGASVAMTGLAVFLGGALTYESVPDAETMPLYPVFGILGGVTGAAIALVGLPIYCAGKYKMQTNDAMHFTFGNDTQRGVTGMAEVGLGFPNCLTLDAVGGYNFNKYVFLGAGLGLRNYLTKGLMQEGALGALPIYANARFTLGSKRVAPYISTSLGYDVGSSGMYTGIEFGSRIRKINSTKDASWWLGTKTEFVGGELGFMSIKLGKTF